MMARIRKSMEEKDQGFTLIELLVVMIIIGILAAIAVPVFLSQRGKARETAAKSDVSVIGKEIAAYYVDGTGSVVVGTQTSDPRSWTLATGTTAQTATTAASVVSSGKVSGLNTASSTGSTSTTWCVQVVTGESKDATWRYSASGGLEKAACS